ncbi:hypothetical protein [Streptomyces longwoodensis]|uniref:hypothetical protein n=1 Tax=Streptomyces longwoodensis TaxID=68231 RepID=UPI0034116C38
MAVSARPLIPAPSEPPAEAPSAGPQEGVSGAEGALAEAPLTSEPPLPDAEPLTSEPPLAAADPDSTRP